MIIIRIREVSRSLFVRPLQRLLDCCSDSSLSVACSRATEDLDQYPAAFSFKSMVALLHDLYKVWDWTHWPPHFAMNIVPSPRRCLHFAHSCPSGRNRANIVVAATSWRLLRDTSCIQCADSRDYRHATLREGWSRPILAEILKGQYPLKVCRFETGDLVLWCADTLTVATSNPVGRTMETLAGNPMRSMVCQYQLHPVRWLYAPVVTVLTFTSLARAASLP